MQNKNYLLKIQLSTFYSAQSCPNLLLSKLNRGKAALEGGHEKADRYLRRCDDCMCFQRAR
jgi:hypothetical protein